MKACFLNIVEVMMNQTMINALESYGFIRESNEKDCLYINKKSGKRLMLINYHETPVFEGVLPPIIRVIVIDESNVAFAIKQADRGLTPGQHLLIYDPEEEVEFFMKDLWNLLIQL